MPPEQSGRWLLERMQRQLGIASFENVALLDFGCGVRFSQAIVNLGLPIGRYAGVDCYRDMIDFLTSNVRDPRFTYHLLDAHHALYNPNGAPLDEATELPLPERSFDVVSMFSVITHQNARETRSILTVLRRYVRPGGHLYFTCFLDPAIDRFEDRSPERNGGRCYYEPAFLDSLVGESGWQVTARYPAEAPLIGDAYVCLPAARA